MSVGRALRELMRDPYRRGEAVLQSSGAHLLLESGDLEVALRSERVAIISCWMKTPRVSRSLSTYIERLSQIGFSSVLINTSEFDNPLVWEHEPPTTTAVYRRPNVGYDFGSWSAALAFIPEVRKKPYVLLTNDSLVGPFTDLQRIWGRAESTHSDLFSLTDSFQGSPHPQSFFLLFKWGTLDDEEWLRFFSNVRQQAVKEDIVGAYEFGVARTCRRYGYSWDSMVNAVSAHAGRGNPTLDSWRALMMHGIPFVKRNIITDPAFAATSLEMAIAIRTLYGENVGSWLPEGYSLPEQTQAYLDSLGGS